MFVVWTVIVLSNTVAEVQGYASAWRGLGSVLLPGTPVVGVVLLSTSLSTLFMALLPHG